MSKVPTRLEVLKRLQAHLALTSPDDPLDFDFDLTDKVFRGRIIFGQEIGTLPAVSIIESPRADAGAGFHGDYADTRDDQWTLLIQGLVEDDIQHPTDNAYKLHAAIEVQLARIVATDPGSGEPLYPGEFNLGGLITDLHVMPPVVRPPEDKISRTAFFFLPVKVGIATPLGQPYTTVV